MNDTPTPRTDEAWAAWPYAGSGMAVHVGRELERELTAVTEQLDALAEALQEIARNALSFLLADTTTTVLPQQQVDDSGDALTMP